MSDYCDAVKRGDDEMDVVCTTTAAYAHICTTYGTIIQWRSSSLCRKYSISLSFILDKLFQSKLNWIMLLLLLPYSQNVSLTEPNQDIIDQFVNRVTIQIHKRLPVFSNAIIMR